MPSQIDLVPVEPLSSVSFAHDCVQLVFQDDGFSLYNDIDLKCGTASLTKGSPGFCDALVRLMNQRAMLVHANDEGNLIIVFEGGEVLRTLPLGEGQRWPESWQFNRSPDIIIVGQN